MTDKTDIKDIKANVVVDFGDKNYAILMGDKSTCVERAILIAAAPELFDTLQELIQTHEYSLRIGYERIIDLGGDCDSPEIMITKDSSLNKAKAAIAKALGQQ
ncbi:hypothetical protein ACK2MR_08670 [Providencia hangzhouensis]|uniref:hypothetical protein n=1 Tax=Providencia hangzhouensis TaxID=3031799 RepID=UPI003F1C1EF0